MQIVEALARLDPTDDQQWTSDGMPRVEVVAKILGAPVTRQQLTDAAPEFSRDHIDRLPAPAPEAAPAASEAPKAQGAKAKAEEPAPTKPAPLTRETLSDLAKHVLEDPPEKLVDECFAQRKRAGAEFLEQPVMTDEQGTELHDAISDVLTVLQTERSGLDAQITRLAYLQARLARYARNPIEYDHKLDQEARMVWIRKQQEARAARYGEAARLAAIAPKSPKAPIDEALGHRAQRGAQRPSYPARHPHQPQS